MTKTKMIETISRIQQRIDNDGLTETQKYDEEVLLTKYMIALSKLKLAMIRRWIKE